MHSVTRPSGLAIAAIFAAIAMSQSVAQASASPGTPISHFAMYVHDVDASALPRERFMPSNRRPREIRLQTGLSAKKYAELKARARLTRSVVPVARPVARPLRFSSPGFTQVFPGLADSATTCPYSQGCAPSDGALAASSSFEMEGVSTSFAVYDSNGALQTGWPKDAVTFFGIPNPGACDPNGAYTADPRAFYDPNDKRFWVEIMEDEGLTNSCPQASRFWIAVSASSDPRGTWHVYEFDMDLGSGDYADFPQLGFNATATCFTGDMFAFGTGAFAYAENFCAAKKRMEQGQSVTYYGFFGTNIGGTQVDTLQPVDTEADASADPGVEFFVASENIEFGGGLCVTGCDTDLIEAMKNPGTRTFAATVATVTTQPYALPPPADEPGCNACIDTDDVRISGTPVYRDGHIVYAHSTALSNGTNTVSAVLFDDVQPTLDPASFAINGATVAQSGYIFFANDLSAYFPVVNTDGSGDLAIVYGVSDGVSTFPSGWMSTHKVTELADELDCSCAVTLDAGLNATLDTRWGDYNGSSWLGNARTESTWFEVQDPSPSGDWETKLVRQTTF